MSGAAAAPAGDAAVPAAAAATRLTSAVGADSGVGVGNDGFDDDYVDVAADLAADTASARDQDQHGTNKAQQKNGSGTVKSSSSSSGTFAVPGPDLGMGADASGKARPTLELKVSTVQMHFLVKPAVRD
jgi:hypothetical protein